MDRTIPTTPESVKQQMSMDNQLAKEAELNLSNEEKAKLERLGLRNRSQKQYERVGPVTGIL